jgi:hypothetical protein
MTTNDVLTRPASSVVGSSFRDPSGFTFWRDQTLLRQVNLIYREHYDLLMASGLYQELVDEKLLVAHTEVSTDQALTADAYKVIQPVRVPFISYPHEWSFSQLRASALATLRIQKRAIKHGMILKDASAYNIMLVEGKPKLIDTLSFEKYRPGTPWIAYRQFCQHFLAPLALMHYTDIRLSQLFVTNIDGIPLDLAAALLPFRSRFNLAVQLHLRLHARAQRRYAGKTVKTRTQQVSQQALLGMIDNLESAIKKWRWNAQQTAWADYYDKDSYTPAAFEHKRRVVEDFITRVAPGRLWDCGANTGEFSRIASEKGIVTVSMDSDPGVVDLNYRQMIKAGDAQLFPIVIDLTAPSPAIGWANRERDSLLARGPADLVLALALIHHLAISNNLPLAHVANFFAQAGSWLVIEFVPKSDPKVQKLLANREDIFDGYTQENFEAVFDQRFECVEKVPVQDSLRTLYLLKRRNPA